MLRLNKLIANPNSLPILLVLQKSAPSSASRQIAVRIRRTFKTTSTEHPVPLYDIEDKLLDKVIQERKDDLPAALANPYTKPKKVCILCERKITPNYKNVKLLYQFVSPYTGMTYKRHVTGLCKDMQGRVEEEITKARKFGLMGYYMKEAEFLRDPKICDPEKPHRPHEY